MPTRKAKTLLSDSDSDSSDVEMEERLAPSDRSFTSSSDEDDEGPTTMANMETLSRALDARAAREAELDVEELQEAAIGAEDDDADMQAGMDEDGEPFHLPSAEERAKEKRVGGPDVVLVQKRMKECVRVLGNFRKLAAKGRY